MAQQKTQGDKGEALAVDHLQEKGYVIRERNWYHRRAEVDIIAEKDGTLAFVEVKTRKNDRMGKPEDWVSKSKQKHLFRAAEGYMDKVEEDVEVRFDIVSVILDGEKQEVEHIEEAFSPSW